MKKNRSAQPFFVLFLGLILAVTVIPPVLGALGARFCSPIQGGAGTHVAGWDLGGTLLRLDLTSLGFAGLIGLLTLLYERAAASRFVRLLGLTTVLFGLADGIQVVRGMVLPEGSVTYFDETLAAMALGRLGGALVLAFGCAVIRWGSRGGSRTGILQVVVPGAAIVAATWWAEWTWTSPPRLPLLDLGLATLLAYGATAVFLRAELRHHRLRFFGRGVLAALIPLAAGQLLVLFFVDTVVDDFRHVADMLRWFAWLIPAAGIGIDYVNSFYARDISLEMRYLRAVIDAVPHFIYARDSRGRYTLVNQAVADFFGRRVHEVEGRHVMDVHPLVDQCREWIAEDRMVLQRDEKVLLPETVVTHHDGHDMWINSIKLPLRSPFGLNDEVLGVSIDVSEQRRAEKALAGALAAAEDSSRAKSEFLANMSHEIRTPMNCIIGLADLLSDMGGDEQQRQYLDMIRMSGSSLLTLINDILDISKIEAGQLELDLVETDLQTLVEETAGLIAFNAQSKGLEMVCRLAPGVPGRLMLDPGRLRQVLTNLLNNATKFTESGHVYLDIEPVAERDGRMDLRFRIIDTGIGIDSQNLERIFEKFTQAEAGTTRRFGGTGLGLAISRHLVRLMGGEVTAESEIGRGTTFSFTIPVAAIEADGKGSAAPDVDRRVLVATDHELGGEVLAEQVRSLGYACRLAVGDAAVADACDTGTGAPWDIVLADQVFFEPGRTGFADALDRGGAGPGTGVYMLNNLSRLLRDDELERLGCDGSLAKPVRLAHLAAVLGGIRLDDTNAGTLEPVAPVCPVGPPDPEDLGQDDDGGPRILLAEDNPFNQKVAVAMLRLIGCRVELATTGVEAVERARDECFDLVLMDCQMPAMDGYEATRSIRRLPAPAGEVPIIAMTANALSGDRRACFAAGMDDFMSKPITRDVLQETLARWGIGEDAERPAPAEPTVPENV